MTRRDTDESKPALRFELAEASDEPELRRIAGQQALPGWVSVRFQRESNYFHAAGTQGDRHQALIAREVGSERIVAMHTRTVQRVYVDGEEIRFDSVGEAETSCVASRSR